jgi:DnaJ-class molecular chaperone
MPIIKEACDSCKGKGWIQVLPKTVRVDCQSCNGNGWVRKVFGYGIKDCWKCFGKGYSYLDELPSENQRCGVCSGWGYVERHIKPQ